MSRTLIIGCGRLGQAVGDRLHADGDQVQGLRRSGDDRAQAPWPIDQADAADAAAMRAWLRDAGPWDRVLLAATPGLRRGRDHGLREAARHIAAWAAPTARVVATGTTAVYGDTGGAPVDLGGPFRDQDPAIAALLAVERELSDHPQAQILRIAAIVGPTRQALRRRMRRRIDAGETWEVGGPLDRPFCYVHEDDLAAIVVAALRGRIPGRVATVAAPDPPTARAYYRSLAAAEGLDCEPVERDREQPVRLITPSFAWPHWRRWDA